jgi:hypothetical protein
MAKRPQAILSRREFEKVERNAAQRAQEATSTRIDQFIRVDIPPPLRLIPGIHNVGHIVGGGGRVLTLIRCDVAPGPAADRRAEAPSIGLVQATIELTMQMVAVLTAPASGALALVLRGRSPQSPDQIGDDTALTTTGLFPGRPAGAAVVAGPPQRLDAHGHLVAIVKTLDQEKILLIRGEDGGISIALPPDFVAHLSLAATEALAQVLEEFATAHGIDVTRGNFTDLESAQRTPKTGNLGRAGFELDGTIALSATDPDKLEFALPIRPLKELLAEARSKHWPAEHQHAVREFAARVRAARSGRPDPFWIVQVEYELDGEFVFYLHMDTLTRVAQGNRVVTQAAVEQVARDSAKAKGGKRVDVVTILVADV